MRGQLIVLSVGHVHTLTGECLCEGSQRSVCINGNCTQIKCDNLEIARTQILCIQVVTNVLGNGFGPLVVVVVGDRASLVDVNVKSECAPLLSNHFCNCDVYLVVSSNGDREGILLGVDLGIAQLSLQSINVHGVQGLVRGLGSLTEGILSGVGVKHAVGNDTGSSLGVNDRVSDCLAVNCLGKHLTNGLVGKQVFAVATVIDQCVLVEVISMVGHCVGGINVLKQACVSLVHSPGVGNVINVQDCACLVSLSNLILGHGEIYNNSIRSYKLIQLFFLLCITVVVGVTLKHQELDLAFLEVLTNRYFVLTGLGVLVVCIKVLGAAVLYEFHSAQLEGTAAHDGSRLLCPVRLSGDILTQGSECHAGQVENELVVVDGTLELNGYHTLTLCINAKVVDGHIAFLNGARVLDVVKQSGCIVGAFYVQYAFPRINNVVCGNISTVGPAGLVEVNIHFVFVSGSVLFDDVLLHQGLFHLAVVVELEQRFEQQVNNGGGTVVIERVGGVKVVYLISKVHGQILAFVFGLLVLFVAASTQASQRANEHDQAESGCKDALCHD